MRLTAFFHVFADGQWQRPLAEFQEALGDFDGPVRWVVAGSDENAEKVRATGLSIERAEFTAGEADTINHLRAFAQSDDGAVLYAHTKGASCVHPFRDRWRRSMLNRVVAPWREHLATLDSGDVDAIGCHWLTEAAFPGMFGPMTIPAEGSGFFGGNFWIARCDYLRTLPECDRSPRWRAESWIGTGRPRVIDLLPGWPDDKRWPELCV